MLFVKAGVLVLGCAVLGAIVVGLLKQNHQRSIDPVPFNRTLWSKETDAHATKEENWRNRMADDVVHRWLRPGMTRKQVVEMLGPGQPLTEKQYHDWQGEDRTGPDPHSNETPVLAFWTLDRIDIDGGSGPVDEIYVFFNLKGRVIRVTQDTAMN